MCGYARVDALNPRSRSRSALQGMPPSTSGLARLIGTRERSTSCEHIAVFGTCNIKCVRQQNHLVRSHSRKSNRRLLCPEQNTIRNHAQYAICAYTGSPLPSECAGPGARPCGDGASASQSGSLSARSSSHVSQQSGAVRVWRSAAGEEDRRGHAMPLGGHGFRGVLTRSGVRVSLSGRGFSGHPRQGHAIAISAPSSSLVQDARFSSWKPGFKSPWGRSVAQADR